MHWKQCPRSAGDPRISRLPPQSDSLHTSGAIQVQKIPLDTLATGFIDASATLVSRRRWAAAAAGVASTTECFGRH